MATQKQKIKVGVFLLLSLAVCAGAIYMISDYKRGAKVPYWIEFNESVLGLYVGGVVEFLGVPVGEVDDIRVTGQKRARVDILINPEKVTLPRDVTAKLVLYSIATGTMAVSLTGEAERTQLAPGSQIPASPSVISSVTSQIQTLFEDVGVIAAELKSGLEGMEPGELTEIIREVGGGVEDARVLVTSTKESIGRLVERAEPGLDEFNELVKDVRELTGKASELLGRIDTKLEPLELDKTTKNLNSVLEHVDELVLKLNSTASLLDTLSGTVIHETDNIEHSVRETMRKINEALDAFTGVAELLREDPSAPFRGKAKREGG